MKGLPPLLLVLLITFPAVVTEVVPSEGEGIPENSFRYHTLDEATSIIHQVASTWEIATVVDSTSLGIEGEEVLSVVVGNNTTAPVLLIVGVHHGDEPVSGEIPLYFLMYLRERWNEGNSTVRALLNHTRVVVVPILNPWGFRYGVRWDSMGQDINRDYPYDPSPADEHSDGVPLSTPATRFMDYLFREYSPEIALSFHSGRRFILYPWGCSAHTGESPDDPVFRVVGRSLAEVARGEGGEMPCLQANTAGGVSYLKGTWLDWAYGASWDAKNTATTLLPSSTLSFTVEISEEKAPEEDLLGSWDEVESGGGGYVSEGVRMCLRALHLTAPLLEVVEAARGRIRVRLHGDPSPSSPQLLSLKPPGVVNSSFTATTTLMGVEYNITFNRNLTGTFVVRVPPGEYISESESSKSAYAKRRRGMELSTPPIVLHGPQIPEIRVGIEGRAEAAGSVNLSVNGARNFTLLEASIKLGDEGYNLTNGAAALPGVIRLPLPPVSGNGTLSILISAEGVLHSFTLPINISPAVYLGGVPDALPAGGRMNLVPYVYGNPPEDTAKIILVGPEGSVRNYTSPLLTPVDVTAPFKVGVLGVTVKCGGYVRHYRVNLTYTLHVAHEGLNWSGGKLRVGPVFISAPGPLRAGPDEVHVTVRILGGGGMEVAVFNLTYREELEPDFEDDLLPPHPGGYYGEWEWWREGNYTVVLTLNYSGGTEELQMGVFEVRGGAEEPLSPYPLMVIATVVTFASLAVLLLFYAWSVRRKWRSGKGGEGG